MSEPLLRKRTPSEKEALFYMVQAERDLAQESLQELQKVANEMAKALFEFSIMNVGATSFQDERNMRDKAREALKLYNEWTPKRLL
jgi:hypothetical protein